MALLSDEEEEKVIIAALKTGLKTEDECLLVYRWAEDAELNAHLLAMTLAGQVNINVSDGEVLFVLSEEEICRRSIQTTG